MWQVGFTSSSSLPLPPQNINPCLNKKSVSGSCRSWITLNDIWTDRHVACYISIKLTHGPQDTCTATSGRYLGHIFIFWAAGVPWRWRLLDLRLIFREAEESENAYCGGSPKWCGLLVVTLRVWVKFPAIHRNDAYFNVIKIKPLAAFYC